MSQRERERTEQQEQKQQMMMMHLNQQQQQPLVSFAAVFWISRNAPRNAKRERNLVRV